MLFYEVFLLFLDLFVYFVGGYVCCVCFYYDFYGKLVKYYGDCCVFLVVYFWWCGVYFFRFFCCLRKLGGVFVNVLVCFGRLGGKIEFLGVVGDDVFGDYLINILKKFGVCINGV